MSESLFPLWDPTIAYPSLETMPDLDIVTHIAVERAQRGGYHYLHESTLVWHGDRLWLGWANHREREVNSRDELIRGSWSVDGGFTWQPPTIWAAPPLHGSASYNHPVIASALGKLWGFFTRWDDERPSTEVFVGDPATGTWESTGTRLPRFVPFRPPMRLADGNWILSGECHWYEGAVAISQGDDFTVWAVVTMPRPEGFELLYPEATLLQRGDELVAIMRPRHTPTSPVSVSRDLGRTWSTIEPSNLPMGTSQPYCGQLTTGQQYLVSNHQTAGRTLLSVAVTAPGGDTFCRVWKIRHQENPRCRLFGGYGGETQIGRPTQWSYPAAVEHDGQLYISYTQGKEDCALSIIPLRVLAV